MVDFQSEQLTQFLAEIEAIKAGEERKFSLLNQMQSGKAVLMGSTIVAGGILLIFGIARISENNLVRKMADREHSLKRNLARHIPEYLIKDLVHEETISPMVWKNCAILWADIIEQSPFENAKERIAAIDFLTKTCDSIYENHGVIQIKNTGQKILAVCKASNLTPMEQANISAVCLNQLRNALKSNHHQRLTLKAGITYGDVVAGLTKSGGKTSFDIWGHPVQEVQEITRSSKPGTISTTKYIARSLNKSEFSINEAEEGRYEL